MITFDAQPSIVDIEESDKENDASLARELFGQQPIVSESPWNSIIFESTRTEVRSGLKEDLRESFLSKFELKGDLECLGPPKLNIEIKSALAKYHSVLKRDEYQTKAQSQVAACLNAFGSGISDLIKAFQNLPIQANIKTAVSNLAEGMHLLADHQHRLSLARQSVIKPCLTFVGKSAADSASVDEWLFGTSFADGLKAAQACEKAGKDLSRFVSGLSATTKVPVQQQPAKASLKGNSKVPALKRTTSARIAGAKQKSSRFRSSNRRSRSRTRSRRD